MAVARLARLTVAPNTSPSRSTHRPEGQPHPHVGEPGRVAGRVGEAQRDLRRRRRVVDDEHDLVADHLHDPAPPGDHHVVGQPLELVDHLGQLLVVDLLGQRR